MASKFVLAGVLLLFLLSLCSLGFFLFFVDPEYLSFSGFALFYVSTFGWLFSIFFLAGYYARGKHSRVFRRALPRRAGLLALLATGTLFFEHLNILSLYVFGTLLLVLLLVEYRLAWK